MMRAMTIIRSMMIIIITVLLEKRNQDKVHLIFLSHLTGSNDYDEGDDDY